MSLLCGDLQRRGLGRVHPLGHRRRRGRGRRLAGQALERDLPGSLLRYPASQDPLV